MAPESHEILQTYICMVGCTNLPPPPHTNPLWSYISTCLRRITFKLVKFLFLRCSFERWRRLFPNLSMAKVEKTVYLVDPNYFPKSEMNQRNSYMEKKTLFSDSFKIYVFPLLLLSSRIIYECKF